MGSTFGLVIPICRFDPVGDAVGALRSARRRLRERRDTVSAARSERRGRRGESEGSARG